MANYLRYANQGATRSQPLDPKLIEALSFLGPMGVTAEVFSGGQPSEGPNRVGSHRHDHGNSGDMFFYKDGRRLNWANEADRPIFEQIVSQGKSRGITGFGAGPGYMQEGSMHVGFGTPAVWGAGGSGANAPAWLRKAYGMTLGNPPPDVVAEVAAAGNAPMLDDPRTVPTIPGQVVASATPAPQAPEMAMGDKIGSAIFGDEMAAKLKATFGQGSPEKSPAKDGLGLLGKALGKPSEDAQAREHATPIQSNLGAEASADASRMMAAQQLMSALLANKRPRGLTLGG